MASTNDPSAMPLLLTLGVVGGLCWFNSQRRRAVPMRALGELASMKPPKPGDALKLALVKFRQRMRDDDVEGARDFLDLATMVHNTLDARYRERAARDLRKAADKLAQASARLLADAEREQTRSLHQRFGNGDDEDDGLGDIDAQIGGLGDLQFEEVEVGIDGDADDEYDDEAEHEEGELEQVRPFGPPDFKFVLPKWQ